MSDPIDELSGFDPGPAMNPLPPSDVRRRGDRLRRRNTVLAGVGGALAVALIATPIALLGTRGDDDAAPDPAPPTVDWIRSIPADFPIDDGMGGGSSIPTTVSDDRPYGEVVLPPLNLCGTDVWSPDDAVDVLGAVWSNRVEGGEQRTLAVYADGVTAQESLAAIADGVDACAPSGPADFEYAGLRSTTGEESYAWVQRWRRGSEPTGDTDVWHAIRVGNAILLNKTYVPDAAPSASQAAADLLGERAEGPVEAMCVFSADGCTTSTPPPSEETTPPASNGGDPADVPLDWDLIDMTGDGGEILGPDAEARGADEVAPCGEVVWPEAGVGRNAVTTTGPEFVESRELVAFESADDAVAVLERVRSAIAACPTQVNEQDPTNSPEQAWDVIDADNGYDSVTFSLTYTDGMPGGTIWQLTRVGRAVLAVDVGGEYARGRSARFGARRLSEITGHITPAMCAFTEAGC